MKTERQRSSRVTRWLTWISMLAVVSVGLGSLVRLALRSDAEPSPRAAVPIAPAIALDFALTDHRGARVTAETYRGKWLLVFFGFTHCPDVCPTTLAEFAEVMRRLGVDAKRVQPLFISVDPERDTPETLAKYVSAFDPRIVGLTGAPEEIARVAKPLGVYFARAPDEGDPKQYTVSHTSYTFLFDPGGRMAAGFGYDKTVDEIVAEMGRLGVSGGSTR